MRNLIFPLVIFFIIKSNVYGNRNAFTSPSCFSMGGAGSLLLSANAQIKNPAVLNKSRTITTSIVKYPALISSQSLDLNFPLKDFVFSSSFKHISYGVFKGYNENGEDIGSYRSNETWVDGYLSKPSTKVSIGESSSLLVSKIEKDVIFNGSLVFPSDVVTVKLQSEYVPETSFFMMIRLVSV